MPRPERTSSSPAETSPRETVATVPVGPERAHRPSAPSEHAHPSRRTALLFAGLALALGGAIALFLTWGVDGHWDFALPRRLEQVAALAVVGIAIAVSTVVFQTLTQNRILTPSIMGFDALYVLVATTLVFFLGAATAEAIDPLAMFALNAGLMMGAATALFRWVLGDGTRGLYTMVLVGVIAGTFFSSLTSFMFRVMNPNEFDTLMDQLFASFNAIDTGLLGIAAVLLGAGIVAVYWMAPRLDVLGLGRERAITLGLPYQRTVTTLLLIVAALVSVSTALVGPITFLGLLAANVAYQLTRTHRHVINLTAAALISVLALVLGQALLAHVLHFNGTLSAIINVVGGIYFIVLLLREAHA
ncbi:iron chelate uptake ABC transporter family permease subunit [Demequina sp. NBRC 110056]|uniref:iron chelate uptake ABC transporter family permease subunit n=1 Tax=Demequina sp. NBRC 110056 TaxID=1570345 RepID=UPI000A05CCE6|nr:iron chelate uptake ABC transporter family permease subunit [Demequina sp. NBRC 110056]